MNFKIYEFVVIIFQFNKTMPVLHSDFVFILINLKIKLYKHNVVLSTS